MAKKVELDFGAGWVDYSAYLKVNPSVLPVIRTRSVFNGDWKPNANTVKLTFERNVALYNTIVSTTIDIPLKITEDGTTPLFTGFIRRSGQISLSQTRVEGFEVEGIDAWTVKLDRKCRSEIYLTTPAICNPSSPANSILHVLFTAAGFTSPELAGLVAIAPTIPLFAVAADTLTFRALVESVLFEFGYSAYIDEEGIVRLYDLGPTSITATKTLSTGAGGNLAGQGSIKPDDMTAEAVDVSYWTTKTLLAAILFEETQGAVGSLACSIPLTSGQYHPDGSSATVDMYAEYKIDGYELIGVSAASVAHVWNHTGHVVRDAFTAGALKALLKFHSVTGGVIIQNKITGNALVRDTQNFIRRENVAGTDRREAIECEYVADGTNAQRLAVIRANRLLYSVYKFQFFSTDLTLYPGEYVNFSDTALTGITGVHRIVSVLDVDSQTVQILTEPVTAFEWDEVSGDGLVPPHNDTQAQITNAATVAREASVSLRLSTRLATWNRALAVSPEDVTASAKYADGTNYLGIFEIALSHDGETWDEVYASAVPESSHVCTIPALIDVSGTMYHVISIRVSLFDPTGLIDKATEYISLTPDVSVAPVHFGPLATPPASGMQANDDYFDTRASISGGGKIYYWTGSAWALMTAVHPQYFAAVSANLTDMIVWCNDNAGTIGNVSAFITALFENIIAQTAMIAKIATSTVYSAALCDDGVTQRMTIDLDNAILTARSADQSKTIKLFDSVLRSTEGANVLDHEGQSLIWRLASTLAELGRIQFDPATGQIRLSAAAVPVTFAGTWTLGTFGASTTGGPPGPTIELPNGDLLKVYVGSYDGYTNLYENIRNKTTGLWGTATRIVDGAGATNPSLAYMSDGRILCAFVGASPRAGAYLFQIIRGTDEIWGESSGIGDDIDASQVAICETEEGGIFCVIADSYLHQLTMGATGLWGDVSDFDVSGNQVPVVCKLPDNRIICLYCAAADTTMYERIRNVSGTLEARTAVQAATFGYPSSVLNLPDGRAMCVHQNITNDLVYRVRSLLGVWSAATLLEAYPVSIDGVLSLLTDGKILIEYTKSGYKQRIDTSSMTTIPLKTDYAPLGMEVGQNPSGIYIRIPLGVGVGIQICWTWGFSQSSGTSIRIDTFTYPAAFFSGAPISLQSTILGHKNGSNPTGPTDIDVPSPNMHPYTSQVSATQYSAGWVHIAGAVATTYRVLWDIFAIGLYTEPA